VREYLGERVAPGVARAVEHDNLLATELAQDLPARPTWEAGRHIGAHNCDEPYLAAFRVCYIGNHPGDGVAFGANRQPIRSVLYVAADVYGAAFSQDRGADAEVAVWRIGFERGHKRGFNN
jgi:hypothetical protein